MLVSGFCVLACVCVSKSVRIVAAGYLSCALFSIRSTILCNSSNAPFSIVFAQFMKCCFFPRSFLKQRLVTENHCDDRLNFCYFPHSFSDFSDGFSIFIGFLPSFSMHTSAVCC